MIEQSLNWQSVASRGGLAGLLARGMGGRVAFAVEALKRLCGGGAGILGGGGLFGGFLGLTLVFVQVLDNGSMENVGASGTRDRRGVFVGPLQQLDVEFHRKWFNFVVCHNLKCTRYSRNTQDSLAKIYAVRTIRTVYFQQQYSLVSGRIALGDQSEVSTMARRIWKLEGKGGKDAGYLVTIGEMGGRGHHIPKPVLWAKSYDLAKHAVGRKLNGMPPYLIAMLMLPLDKEGQVVETMDVAAAMYTSDGVFRRFTDIGLASVRDGEPVLVEKRVGAETEDPPRMPLDRTEFHGRLLAALGLEQQSTWAEEDVLEEVAEVVKVKRSLGLAEVLLRRRLQKVASFVAIAEGMSEQVRSQLLEMLKVVA